jgi:hypothetical protein
MACLELAQTLLERLAFVALVQEIAQDAGRRGMLVLRLLRRLCLGACFGGCGRCRRILDRLRFGRCERRIREREIGRILCEIVFGSYAALQ